MSGSPTAELLYSVEGDIGIVAFNRPSAHNALTFAMYERLGEICAGLTVPGPVKALIVAHVDSQNGFGALLRSRFNCMKGFGTAYPGAVTVVFREGARSDVLLASIAFLDEVLAEYDRE